MSTQTTSRSPRADAEPGDWLEVRALRGEPVRRGEILEVIGRPGHHRYRVRWDEQHESVVYPADGIHVVPGEHRRPRRRH